MVGSTWTQTESGGRTPPFLHTVYTRPSYFRIYAKNKKTRTGWKKSINDLIKLLKTPNESAIKVDWIITKKEAETQKNLIMTLGRVDLAPVSTRLSKSKQRDPDEFMVVHLFYLSKIVSRFYQTHKTNSKLLYTLQGSKGTEKCTFCLGTKEKQFHLNKNVSKCFFLYRNEL